MKVVAAYLLAVLGGNDHPSVKDVKKILSSVGADADDGDVQRLIDSVGDKDPFELIESGRSKLAAVPVGGGGAPVAAATATGGAPAAATGAAPAKEEAKKKPEPESESEDEDAFGGLF
jgi:large subunit ribosomal protein LP2